MTTDALLSRIGAPIGHILHIGAGGGSDIPGYVAGDPDAITLIEPDSGALAQLQMAVQQVGQGQGKLRVIEAAISPDAAAGPLQRFGFGDLNSLRAPTGLHAVFPGLEQQASAPVMVRDPVTLVSGLDLGPDRAHVLVIEAPGEALAIVQALDRAGLLTRFAAIRVQEGREPLYEGAGRFSQVRALLDAAGFSRDPQVDDADPERPVLSVLFDAQIMRRQALEDELAQLRADRDRLEGVAGDLRATLTKERREKGHVKASLTRRENQITVQKQKIREAEQQARALEVKCAAQARELEAGAARLAGLRTELEAVSGQFEQMQAQLAEQSDARQAAEQQARALETKCAAQARELEAGAAKLAGLSAAEAKLRTELEAVSRQSEQMQAQLAGQADARQAAEQQARALETKCAAQARELEALKITDHHLALSREDMLRAEGQIEIIKDLLLRGPEL